MLRKWSHPYFLFIRNRGAVTACALPVDPPSPSLSSTSNDHKTLCLSLLDKLVSRGRLSPAQFVIQRIIYQSPSLSDALFATNYAAKVGMVLDVDSYGILIRKLVQYGESRLAAALYYKNCGGRGIRPNILVLNSMVTCFCVLGKIEEAWSCFDRLVDLGSIPSKAACNLFLRELFVKGMVLDAFNYFRRIIDARVHMGICYYNTLMDKLCCKGHWDEAYEVINLMEVAGISATPHQYKSLFYGFCKSGRVEDAWQLSVKMESRQIYVDRTICTCLIQGYSRERKLAQVDTTLDDILKNGVIPDHLLYFILMKLHQKGHELELAFKILQVIFINGCHCEPDPPFEDLEWNIEFLLEEISQKSLDLARIAFTICITALCETGEMDAAFDLLDKMENIGCQPLLFTYNSLIKCLCKRGLFDGADSIIDHMRDRGMAPDVQTYLIMVNEYCKQGRLKSALNAVEQMIDMGSKPNIAIYHALITCLGMQKRVSEAEEVFKIMCEEGICPDEIVLMTMINAYMKTGKLQKVIELFDKMPNFSVESTDLVNTNMTGKCHAYLDRMNKKGLQPNKALYTSVIGHFLKQGEFEIAFLLVNLMGRNHTEYDPVFYIVLYSGIRRLVKLTAKRWDVMNRPPSTSLREHLFSLLRPSYVPGESFSKIGSISPETMKRLMKRVASKYLLKIKNNKYVPNLYLYNCLISMFSSTNMTKEAYDCLDLMRRDGLRANQVTYTILMDGHIHYSEIDSAVDVFKKMNADDCPPDRIAFITLVKGLYLSGRFMDARCLSCMIYKKGLFRRKSFHKILLRELCR